MKVINGKKDRGNNEPHNSTVYISSSYVTYLQVAFKQAEKIKGYYIYTRERASAH